MTPNRGRLDMSYEEAQDSIRRGEQYLKEGDVAAARQCFLHAAHIYEAFVTSLPTEKRRTRSMYGLDAVELLYRAGDLGEAERVAHRILGEEGIEDYPRLDLQDLLARISDELHFAELGIDGPERDQRRRRHLRYVSRRRRRVGRGAP
jgi:hypothetical protein